MTDALEHKLNTAHNEFMDAGRRWQTASLALLEGKILEAFPTAKWAELTVIIDESYAEHSIEVFDHDHNELTDGVDFPSEDAYGSWWLLASEGAVFGEGTYITITIGDA